MMRSIDKGLLALAVMITCLMTLFSTGVVYMLLESVPQFVIADVTYPTDQNGKHKDEFRVGEMLYYWREGLLIKLYPCMVRQVLRRIDTNAIYWHGSSVAPTNVKLGPFKQLFVSIVLPAYLPEGNFELQTSMTCQINRLRNDEEQFLPPVPFKVVK